MLRAATPTILLCSFHDKFSPRHLSPHRCQLIGKQCLPDIPSTHDPDVTKPLPPCFMSASDTWVLSWPLKITRSIWSLQILSTHPVSIRDHVSFLCLCPGSSHPHACAHTHAGTQIHSCVKTDKDIPKDKTDNWWLEGVVWISHPSSQCLPCPRSSPVAEIQLTNYPNSEQGKTN